MVAKPVQEQNQDSAPKAKPLTEAQHALIKELKQANAKVIIDPRSHRVEIKLPGGYEVHSPQPDGRTKITKDIDWSSVALPQRLKLLGRLSELPVETVYINNPRISTAEFERICQLSDLSSLYIGENNLPKQSYLKISTLIGLKNLKLSSNQIDTEALVSIIAPLTKLEKLLLYKVQISPLAIQAVAKIKTLRTLDVSFIDYDQDVIDEILKINQLKSLRLGSFYSENNDRRVVGLDTLDIARISNLGNLTSFDTHGHRLTDESWQAIGKLRGIRGFRFWGAKFSAEQFKKCLPALYPIGEDQDLSMSGFSTPDFSDELVSILLDDVQFCQNKIKYPVILSSNVTPDLNGA